MQIEKLAIPETDWKLATDYMYDRYFFLYAVDMQRNLDKIAKCRSLTYTFIENDKIDS